MLYSVFCFSKLSHGIAWKELKNKGLHFYCTSWKETLILGYFLKLEVKAMADRISGKKKGRDVDLVTELSKLSADIR